MEDTNNKVITDNNLNNSNNEDNISKNSIDKKSNDNESVSDSSDNSLKQSKKDYNETVNKTSFINLENIKERTKKFMSFQEKNILENEKSLLDETTFNSYYFKRNFNYDELKLLLSNKLKSKTSKKNYVSGIKNTGNSCYISSIIQAMSQNLDLLLYILRKDYENELNYKSIYKGQLALNFFKIIETIWSEEDSTLNIQNFRTNCQALHAMFSTNNQQDPSEFLLYLLDGLNSDLSAKSLSLPNKEIYDKDLNYSNNNFNNNSKYSNFKLEGESDLSASRRIWNNFKDLNPSVFTEIYYGQIKNSLLCPECLNTSISFEMMSCLYLAIPNIIKINVIYFSSNYYKMPIKLPLWISDTALFFDIEKYLSKYFKKERIEKVRCLLSFNQTHRLIKSSEKISNVAKKGNILIFEIGQYLRNTENAEEDNYSDEENDNENNDYYPLVISFRENTKNTLLLDNKDDVSKLPNETNDNINIDLNSENIVNNNKKSNKNKGNKKKNNKNKESENVSLDNSLISIKTANSSCLEKDNSNDINYLSFSRIIPINPYSYIIDLKLTIFGYLITHISNMTDYINEVKNINDFNFENVDRLKNLLDNIIKDKDGLDINYINIIKNSYNKLIDYHLTNKINFPFSIYLTNETFLLNQNNNTKTNKESIKLDNKSKLTNKTNLQINKIYLLNGLFEEKEDNLENNNLSMNAVQNLNDKQTCEDLIKLMRNKMKLHVEIHINNQKDKNLFVKSLNSIINIKPVFKNEDENIKSTFNKDISIEDCITHYQLMEKLEKGNEVYCYICKKSQQFYKKSELFVFPRNLVILFKRFNTIKVNNKIQFNKNDALITFPVDQISYNNKKSTHENHLYFKSKSNYNDAKYELYSVSQHAGSIDGGHYFTSVKNMGMWFGVDDASVFECDYDSIVIPESYILFYRKK